MQRTDLAIGNDPDWAVPFMECHADPTEGYLHVVLSSGEVLPLSMALALPDLRVPMYLGTTTARPSLLHCIQ